MTRVVLLGGGHAHACALREFARSPAPGAEITLVSPASRQIYSGMLPGLVAGHYALEDCQVDLERLARAAGAGFVRGAAIGLDPARRQLLLEDGARLDYDFLAINIGSLPNFAAAPGSAQWAIPVKPFERLLEGWTRIRSAAASRSVRIAYAGAGAAGVELALAMQFALGRSAARASFILYSDQAYALPDRPPAARRAAERILAERGVELKGKARIASVERDVLVLENGSQARFDFLLWTAGAAPQPWLVQAGIATDRAGFVLVDDTLRSVSHPEVFASGDSATLARNPHPKSGVYAIRHGAVLARNLRAARRGAPLERYAPQARQLALISAGGKYAIATRGGWALEGAWAWRWKDWIDRRWIAGK